MFSYGSDHGRFPVIWMLIDASLPPLGVRGVTLVEPQGSLTPLQRHPQRGGAATWTRPGFLVEVELDPGVPEAAGP